ncbi:WSSV096 [White spot syndrome virus]|uniref:WSSV096 n=1 Tax=White spot syndrome virus TaxID=342409 RepID=A0A2I6SBN6_9VIRU|nr:WSSV096 [White spot syndrome virus]
MEPVMKGWNNIVQLQQTFKKASDKLTHLLRSGGIPPRSQRNKRYY